MRSRDQRKIWDAQSIDQLLGLWREGETGGQIALRFGVTRSAVMGKLNRLGAIGDPEKRAKPTVSKAKAPPPAPPPAPPIQSRPPVYVIRKPGPRPEQPPPEPSERRRMADEWYGRANAPMGSAAAVNERRTGECAWPVGDPKSPIFRFCLAPANGEYCDRHARVREGARPDTRRSRSRMP